ncbi:hypothetical protein GHT09_010396 [Marmota monax]|uniref:Stabilin-1 n=1 Tax=Marmota monax TaxID=9995 RepID=A0A834UJY7_MARMO|nr:hypothetical protein GHT09_010396 [Marmota monax]
MAEPRGLLLLCVLVSCLANSSFIRGQKVQFKRCDIKTKLVEHTPCTTCTAIQKQVCPSGWPRRSPEKISQDCRYEIKLGDTLMSKSGCSLECWKEVEQKACCPGYWGSQCYECPGGAETPCNGHGTCLDGMARNGTCVCQENFSGSACQECRDPHRFGPDCQSVCSCVHGVCKSGPLGDGSCLCFAGYTGPRCDQEDPTCKCLPGYTQQGSVCLAPNPCQPSPCSPLARCSVSPNGKAQCHCPENYHGDGKVCLPQDPCTIDYGGCPSNSTLCLYQRPGKATCSCQPGLISINNNASMGCFAVCYPYSCDLSATCQLTPEGKTRCVCKEDEVGDGHACYGHLLSEVQKARQIGLLVVQLRVAISMFEQGCQEILTSSGPFTVLVPSIIFSRFFTTKTMSPLLAQKLCRQYIIPGQHMLEDLGLQRTHTWWTLAGKEITVTNNRRRYSFVYKDQPQKTFNIQKPNYLAANGIFHVVSYLRWELPPGMSRDPKGPHEDSSQQKTIGQILASTEVFSRFEIILENCGLPSILDGPGPFTVFAPSNEAVDSLRDGRLIYLFTAGLSKLQELVRYHIYNHGQMTVEKLISKGRVLTMANQVLNVNISEEGRILLGPKGVPLRRVDVLASNGVIHMLEGILLPPTILPILPKHCGEDQYNIVASRCTCKLGFAGDGYECSPIDPCRAGNGGCHGLATCQAVGGGQRICKCPPGFGGDGLSCYGDIIRELQANAHFSAFSQWFQNASITLPANGQVTALVPSESAIRRLNPEDRAFWLQPKMLPHLVRAHFLQGALSEEELARLDRQNVTTLDPTTRWEIRNISGRVWVQNASVDVADLLTTNGVLHILSQVLLPSRADVQGGQGLLQQLDLVPAFRLFRELLQRHGLVPQIEAATAYTIFVPTNGSLEAQSNGSSLNADTVRHHVILGEALSVEALRKGGHRNSLLGPAHWLVFYNHSGQPEVNHVPLEGPLLEAPGSSLFGLSGVLTVGSSRCLHSHAEALREKCINCTGKFRCTRGFQLQDTPRKSCVYRSGFSFSRGCSYTCVKKIQVPDCCPGFFGTLCEPCPGGLGGVCSGHGQCQDRLLGNGECRCHEGFHGTACEMCELGRYGPSCTGVCDCAHGMCQEGLQGDGSCVCNVGWQGLRCDQKIVGPQCPKKCDPNANCIQNSTGSPTCVCAAGYSGNGSYCSEVDPCANGHGGCSPHANCTKVAPGQRTCTCQDGYTGDGELCQEINSCLIRNGGCHIHAECIPTGPQQVSCSCREGYSGDGIRTCDLLDPCSQNNGGCSPYATCKSTGDGQRTCTCNRIHTVGDGFTCRARLGLELFRDKHASFFSRHLLEYTELKGNGPFTVFVPQADLMTNLSQNELARIRANRQLVFRYHVVGCQQLHTQELLDQGYATALSGHTLRFSEREGSIYLNDFARVVSSDHEAVNGILHFIDRVLLPPEVLHWEPDATPIPSPLRNVTDAAESFGYKIFSHLMTVAGLLPMLRDVSHRPLTMLWPTDSALQALPPDRQAWLYHEDHRDKLAAILRGHVIRNVEALASDMPNLGSLRTMHGTPISFSCSRARPGELMVGEDDARIVQRHMPFEGGLAYGIDQLLEPPGLGARCDRFETRPLRLKTCSICGLEPPCPEGSREQGSPETCWRYYAKLWSSPSLHSLALGNIWVRPSFWSHPQGKSRGCHRNCVTTTWVPSCCPGHYGSECQACPGNPRSPCNGHGVCLDGMSGSGRCRCHSGFTGTACELCTPGFFGPQCQACSCTSHGRCDEGLGGSGSCFCDEGWTGPHCEVQLELQPVCTPPCASQAMCRAGNSCECSLGYEGDGRVCTVADLCQDGHGGCSEHANCSQVGTVVTCVCLPDYEGDGWSCRARNPCADGHRGGCSEHANCLNTGPNTRRCECHAGYVGDGLQCLEEAAPPVDRCLGHPSPCHTDAVCTDLHFQEKRAGVFHLQATSGPYGLNFSEAEAACGDQGAVLASVSQLSAAQQLGFHLCLMGWLANGSAAHPVVFPAADCGDGRVGVVSLGVRKNLSERWDAYCYREQDVSCQCKAGFVGDGISICNGKLLDVLAATANFSTFYGMLLSYANATQKGFDFLRFLDDELTYKTLFVPVNEGFVDNMTLSGPDLELHASNATFLSTNASQRTLLPAHSGVSLVISDTGPGNNSWAPVAPGAVLVGRVIIWDIMAFNGIIHALASPLLAPPQPGAVLAPEAPPVAAGVGAVVAAGTLISLVAAVLYLRARGKPTGFGFSAFQAEDDAADDFSPWQEVNSPTLVSVPNPVFGNHDAFCEPFDDSLLEDDFPDTQRILAVK